jgi:uncharacterized protein (DUF2267 family)
VADATEPPDPRFQRARVVIQAVNETIADLQSRHDSAKWAEQITTLETMRDRLVAELTAAENAA